MRKHSLSIALCSAAALVAIEVFAQTPIAADSSQTQNFPLPLRETLKNIPAANISCRKDDYAGKPGETLQRPGRAADSSCAMTLEQLSASLGKPETVLVDTRSKAAFDRLHIDGAVNFSGSEIRAKGYLADKLVVLLTDGKGDQELYELCAELKNAGFKKTRVLRGGLQAWVLDNKPVIGTAPNFSDFASLSPAELFQASKVSDNIIIGLPNTRKLSDVLPMMFSASGDSPEAIKEFMKKRKKSNSPHPIILVADERFEKGQLADLAKLAKPDPLFAYTGSDAAYRQFLLVQSAMWAKQAKGPVKPSCGAM